MYYDIIRRRYNIVFQFRICTDSRYQPFILVLFIAVISQIGLKAFIVALLVERPSVLVDKPYLVSIISRTVSLDGDYGILIGSIQKLYLSSITDPFAVD